LDLWSGFWWWFARLVAAGFVLLAGWSWAARRQRSMTLRQLFFRLGRLGGAAALISLVTLIGFGPTAWIFFGVLHLLTVSSVLAWPLALRPKTALLVGILCLGSGLLLGQQRFSFNGLAWLGFRSTTLQPMDYLPLLPWFAWFCFGCALYPLHPHKLHQKATDNKRKRPTWCVSPSPLLKGTAALCWLGRHSLLVYLLHVPVLYGLSLLVGKVLQLFS